MMDTLCCLSIIYCVDMKLDRLVRFKYTKTNLLVWQTVVAVVAVVDFADYDKVAL